MANDTNKLSPAAAAVNAALVAQYIGPAKLISRKSAAIEKAKGDTWGAFKDAAGIGLDAGQTVETMGKGLSLACAHEDVPQGTVNAYLPLLRKLFTAITSGEVTRDDAMAMSVKDARAKWQPKKAKAAKAEPVKVAAGEAEAGEAGDGGTDGDVMGGTERSRTLSRINTLLAALSDDDLSGFLALLEGEVTGEVAEG